MVNFLIQPSARASKNAESTGENWAKLTFLAVESRDKDSSIFI
jgi:hypothetical protein